MWNAGVWRQLEWPQDEREMSVGQRMMCRRAGAHRYLQLGPGSAAHGCALRRARDKTFFLFCLALRHEIMRNADGLHSLGGPGSAECAKVQFLPRDSCFSRMTSGGHRIMDVDLPAGPRMPKIKKLTHRSYGRFIVELYNHHQPHSRLGWMSPAIIYAAQRRQAALRSTDGAAPRTAAITAQQRYNHC